MEEPLMTRKTKAERLRQEYEDLMKQGRREPAHRVLAERDALLMRSARFERCETEGCDRAPTIARVTFDDHDTGRYCEDCAANYRDLGLAVAWD